jgi:hypothetical protein
MSSIYPRKINLYRWTQNITPSSGGFGAQPYQEPQTTAGNVAVWQTTPIFSGVQCSIQEYRSGTKPLADLPGNSLVTPTTKIYIPKTELQLGQINMRDYLMDDVGIQYMVIDNYWNILGYRLYCVYLQL